MATPRVNDGDADMSDHTDATTSASEANEQERPAKRRTNTTYGHRRDEIVALREEIERLQQTVQHLEATPREPQRLANAVATYSLFEKHIEHNNLMLAGTQSLISSYNAATHGDNGRIPLHTRIHLPRDPSTRTQILQSMRELKLQSALRFLTERVRTLDMRRAHRQSEQFDLDNGEVAEVGFQILHAPAGYSLRQVFDSFMFFMTHQEITVSEHLGALTIRESDEIERPAFEFCQTRLLSTMPEGLTIESNEAMFATYNDATEATESHALFVMDYIEQDDLHPWRPDMCARKETTAAVLFNEVVSERGERVVAVTRWAHMRFRPPHFPLSPATEAAVRENLMSWVEVVRKVMRERLKLVHPAYERQGE